MERQKKSCSCFAFFSKKEPKKIEEGTDSRPALRSSLINFSNNRFGSEENAINNSLSSTQKLQSNAPFVNTLTSPLCITSSMFQFSAVNVKGELEKPGTSMKPQSGEGFLQRRNSLPASGFEEIPAVQDEKMPYEEKKFPEKLQEKIPSTETSLLLKQEKTKDPVPFNLIFKALPDLPPQSLINPNPPFIEPKSLQNQLVFPVPKAFPDSFQLASLNPVPIQSITSLIETPETQNLFTKSIQTPLSPISNNLERNISIPVCENSEKKETKAFNPVEEKVKIFPEPLFFISKEEPVVNLISEKFQVDVFITKQEEPVFLKIGPKTQQPDEPLNPDFVPAFNIPKPPTVLPPFPNSPKLNLLRNPDPIFENNIFIKGAAKKSFENLVNRFSSDKKLQSLAEKLKVRQPSKSLHPEAGARIQSKVQKNSEDMKGPQKVDFKLESSQEILKVIKNRISGLKHPSESLIKIEDCKSCPKERKQLNHSKSYSVNNTIIVHESKEYSKRISFCNKDFEASYSEKALKSEKEFSKRRSFCNKDFEASYLGKALKSGAKDYPKRLSFCNKDFETSYSEKALKCEKELGGDLKEVLSPRVFKRLPSLKISPIKSILSVDDYSDILSFLKNSPQESAKKEPKLEVKKYKLPALKPITPHYFHKKRSAPQIKNKARVLIENL